MVILQFEICPRNGTFDAPLCLNFLPPGPYFYNLNVIIPQRANGHFILLLFTAAFAVLFCYHFYYLSIHSLSFPLHIAGTLG